MAAGERAGGPAEHPRRLTADEKKQYVADRGCRCPFCHSQSLEGESYNGDGATIAQDITCLRCRRVWTDVYTLSAIEEKDP